MVSNLNFGKIFVSVSFAKVLDLRNPCIIFETFLIIKRPGKSKGRKKEEYRLPLLFDVLVFEDLTFRGHKNHEYRGKTAILSLN